MSETLAEFEGGGEARANAVRVELPDGTSTSYTKATRLSVPKGAAVHLYTGGGGGYGDPSERDPQAVADDITDGYVSEDASRTVYPHAFTDGDGG